MSMDYVAIMTTVIIAEVAVGSLLMHSFMKIAFSGGAEDESRGRSQQAQRRRAGFYLKALILIVWFGLAGNLLHVELNMLAWAGQDHPDGTGADPDLAKAAFAWTVRGMWVLAAEGVIRAIIEALRPSTPEDQPSGGDEGSDSSAVAAGSQGVPQPGGEAIPAGDRSTP
ncbi:hypothetical protein ACFW96_33120 [Streptomyces gardneri]|uniref:hypothetical protein n=1 Tax=Streptomyces gardneri TaxID=66892 RepID=UPI00368A8700